MHSSHLEKNAISDFQNLIRDQAFPCVGAKAALAKNQIQFFLADDITKTNNDAAITKALQLFAAQCDESSLFVSFAVIFTDTSLMSEVEFEHYLWSHLQSIHEYDAAHFLWDEHVNSDPDSPHFSMSIGGKAFYIVGLHPGASRPARQFSNPMLVFNLHSQFELLRHEGNYARIRETILERDLKISGSYNPMLAVHGQSSEARQYSGREVEKNWKCPFRFLHRKNHD